MSDFVIGRRDVRGMPPIPNRPTEESESWILVEQEGLPFLSPDDGQERNSPRELLPLLNT